MSGFSIFRFAILDFQIRNQVLVNPQLNRSSIFTTVCSKSVTALSKTELCDKVLNLSASCDAFDLGSPIVTSDPWFLLRKEVIQPQVPLRLPCYDFIPITIHTFGTFLGATSGTNGFHDVTGGVYKAWERIHGAVADAPLLAIPASCRRVADDNLNWARFSGICST
jgi:hypothetical protein